MALLFAFSFQSGFEIQQLVDHVAGRVGTFSLRDEARDLHQIVAAGEQRLFD